MKFKRIIIILILVIILVGLIIAYAKKNSSNTSNNVVGQSFNSGSFSGNSSTKSTTLKSNSEVKSASVEQIEPHATYYLEEVCVDEGDYIAKGENILKYTNGTYMTAPYDCTITGLNLPDVEEKLLNSHYVEVSSINVLSVSMSVSESNIGKLDIGKEAKISIVTNEKEYVGYITNISSTASNGNFTVTIEFENDGSIMLGMTAKVEVTI